MGLPSGKRRGSISGGKFGGAPKHKKKRKLSPLKRMSPIKMFPGGGRGRLFKQEVEFADIRGDSNRRGGGVYQPRFRWRGGSDQVIARWRGKGESCAGDIRAPKGGRFLSNCGRFGIGASAPSKSALSPNWCKDRGQE